MVRPRPNGPPSRLRFARPLNTIQSTGLYSAVTVRTYPWTRTYTTREYLQLLNTYSDHLSLDEGRRCSLYQSIADLIERRFDGKVERPYLSVLYLAKKGNG